ncbi:hypothetical protein WD019_06380 [Fictibacillus sp. Mic-4]|uniref:hypothetical protein n=1 Tax=Fictibacillus sp. Mic-4 TaxID=3132826 RepID=UPI003CF25983
MADKRKSNAKTPGDQIEFPHSAEHHLHEQVRRTPKNSYDEHHQILLCLRLHPITPLDPKIGLLYW